MRFAFRPLTAFDVEELLTWRYEAPYDEYDPAHDPGDVEEFREAIGSPTWFAVDDEETGAFVGFLDLRPDAAADEVEIGLGLRPEHTGRGLGPSFVRAALALIRAAWDPARVTLDVLPWNERALRAYERVGFVRGETYDKTFEDGNVVRFVRMTLEFR